jgi:hypothetical protein
MVSLEQRIADVLADPEIGSEQLVKLITEAESAAQEADASAAKARADALDPAVVVDAAKVGVEVATSELRRDRMRAALPRLHEAHRQARAREHEIAWLEDYRAIEIERDALVADLAKEYPDCVRRLLDILGKVPGVNARIAHLNSHAPRGVGDRLQYVEQAARGEIGPNGLLSLMTDLRLPKWVFERGDRYQLAWPPPQPALAAQVVSSVPYFDAANWHEEWRKRNERTIREVEAAEAAAVARALEREEKEKAEIAAAKERDMQWRRERGWPV